ncbi:O-antigen polymerase [Paenibacillus sp. IHBB 3054]|uniref:O-antigen polymerase n=1 Tax=Paenibacillus sp. IHBB 3054 TaxID=3425689 RepID=UPI003F66A7CC
MLDIFKSLYIILLIVLSLSINESSFAFVCTIISLVIYIGILKKENGQNLLINIRFVFIIFLFIYSNSYSFLKLYMGRYLEVLNYLPLSTDTIEKGMLLSNLFIMIYILLSIWARAFVKDRIAKSNEFYKNIKNYLINFELTHFILIFDLFALILCVNYIRNVWSGGLINIIMSGVSRVEANEMVESQPYWVFMYFIVAYSCAIYTTIFNKIRFNNIKSKGMIVRVSVLSLFWIFDILLGNRRLVSYILLYLIFYIIVTKKKKISFYKVMLFVAFSFVFVLVGYLRTVGFSLENANIENVINDSFGEFFIPINTFYYYLENQIDMLYGASYFSALLFMFPRALWPAKPDSLAVTFANIFGGGMGYGFNPIAEAYINFGILFVVLLPILLVLLFSGIEALSKKSLPIYFFVFIQTMNFNRGEFASTLIEFTIMYLSFLLIANSKKKYDGKEI